MADAQRFPPKPNHSVLVVDDEDYVADMIASALEIEGYTTFVSYNGRDALSMAQELRVDLVVIDIMLPYINGIALVEQMRLLSHLRAVPIVLISAGARPRSVLPNVTFLPKPFDMEHLLSLIAQEIESEADQHGR